MNPFCELSPVTRRLGVYGLATLLAAVIAAPLSAQVSLGLNRLRVVSAGGSATQNCQGLRDALAAITDNDFDHPYVLLLEPGSFDCGTQKLTMKALVDIKGSGSTSIFGNVDDAPVVALAPFSALREIGVSNTGNGPAVEARDVPTGLPLLDRVAAVGQNGPGLNVVNSGIVTVKHSTLQRTTSGAALEADGSSAITLLYTGLLSGKSGAGSFVCRYSYSGSTLLSNTCS